MIVADASLLVALLVHKPSPNEADVVLERDPAWSAPPFWRAEMHSALLKYLRAQQLTTPETEIIMSQAARLVSGREQQASTTAVLRAATTIGISSYDAEYVALAELLGVPLITFDQKLVRAARGIALSPAEFVR